MKENLNDELKNTKFGKNKYYVEIIKNFISGYSFPRVTINDDSINVIATDRGGSRDIEITINELDRLVIKVNRNVGLERFQDIIVYDNQGIMMERTNTKAELKKDVNEKFQDRPNILVEEFKELGEIPTVYTNQIFNNIRFKKIIRPDNFGINGLYKQKDIFYDERGLMKSKVVEGTFNVLKSNSISTLEFPNTADINITKEDEFDDNDIIINYPNSRSL